MKTFKIVFLGDSSVGKTSIIARYVNDNFSPTSSPTIGASFLSKIVTYKEEPVQLDLWDTAGQEMYRSLTPMYYRNANVVILVFDMTNNSSFHSLPDWLELIKNNSDSVPTILVENKIDSERDETCVSSEELANFAKSNHLLYFEVSALDGTGISLLFENIIKVANSKNLEPELISQNITANSDGKSGCCK